VRGGVLDRPWRTGGGAAVAVTRPGQSRPPDRPPGVAPGDLKVVGSAVTFSARWR